MANKIAVLIPGADITIVASLIDLNTGKPFYMQDFIAATAYFPKSDDLGGGSISAIAASGISPSGDVLSVDCAQVRFKIPKSDSIMLKQNTEGLFQSAEIIVDKVSGRSIAQEIEMLDIKTRIFQT